MESALYSLKDIRLSFPGSHGAREIFRGLSLTIREGEVLTVVGPSGEGKTVLLKMLAGLIPPENGQVLFRGADLYGRSKKDRRLLSRRIGMAFQKGGLFDFLTTAGNLSFPLKEVLGLSKQEIEPKVRAALEDVGLAGQEALEVRELSGGMQKRLGIARTLVLSPEVALYDDPTAGLDPITSRSILELIQRMKEKYRMTVVIVTSDPRATYSFTDRIGFLYGGRFLEVASAEAIRQSRVPEVRQFIDGSLTGPLTTRAEQEAYVDKEEDRE